MKASALTISNVRKSFKANHPVLRDVSLSVAQGEMVGLIGASGSGKSTLIRLIAGFETIDRGAGEIRLFDRECQKNGQRRGAIRELRHDVGIIFQQFNLIGRLSLLTNVIVGRLGRISRWRGTLGLFPHADKVKALKALERVGIIDQAHQRASTLSGGQQQRAAIARAMTQEAKLILADEPIASLDPASAENVMSTLREINRVDGVTVIVSLHQIDHAFKHCDRIIALKDGVIVHDGDVAAITKDDIRALYGTDAFDDDDGGDIEKKRRKEANGKGSYKGTLFGKGHRQSPGTAETAVDVTH